MKPLTRGLLAGCAVLLVLAVLAAIAGVRFLRANRDRFRAQADQVRAEGREFGRSATASACVGKAMDAYRDDSSLLGEARARVWLVGCLEGTTPASAFCARVPPTDQIARTVSWRLGQCSGLGLSGDKGCLRIVAEVQKHCERGRARS